MIDPRISLAAQAPNVESSFQLFQNTLNNMQNRKINSQNMQQSADLFPLQMQQQQQNIGVNNQAIQEAEYNKTLQSINSFAPILRPLLESGDTAAAMSALQQREKFLIDNNRDPQDTQDAIRNIMMGNSQKVLQDLDAVQAEVAQISGGGQTAGEREFLALTEGFTQDEVDQARRVKARIEAPASSSAVERIAQDGALGGQVATQAQVQAQAKETGTLTAKLNLEPKVKEAIATTLANVKAIALDKTKEKSNAKAFELYQAGIKGLADAFSNASTGVISGTMFALTDNNRIAKGAGAVMLPIMKDMFRSAGEGIFTDKDQEVLEKMLPTTNDSPAVAKSKLRLMDVIVQAKIGPKQQTQDAKPAPVAPPAQINIEELTDADIENLTEEQLNALLGQ